MQITYWKIKGFSIVPCTEWEADEVEVSYYTDNFKTSFTIHKEGKFFNPSVLEIQELYRFGIRAGRRQKAEEIKLLLEG